MKTKNKNNLIVSIILAIAPIGPLALLLPAGEVVVGVLVVAALAGLGYMELRHGAAAELPRRHRKDDMGAVVRSD